MKTKIVEREDVKVMPTISALHGSKGVLGNQEIGGGLPFCVIEEICDCDCIGCDQCRDSRELESNPGGKRI